VRNIKRDRCIGGPGVVKAKLVQIELNAFRSTQSFLILGLRSVTVNVDAMWELLHEKTR
jgi:hypothetical protein